MDDLPIEVVKLIAKLLVHCKLAVNKKYSEIYNEDWFKEYLTDLYPNMELWVQKSYKHLCEKEYCCGTVTEFSIENLRWNRLEYLSNCIINASYWRYSIAALNFNGDLFVGRKKIATTVTHSDRNMFVSKNVLYRIELACIPVKVLGVEDVIKIKHIGITYYILTNKILYVGIEEFSEIGFDNAIDMCIGEQILVLERNGNVYGLEPDSDEKVLLFTNGIKLLGNAVLLVTGEVIIPLTVVNGDMRTNYLVPIKCKKVINYYNDLYILDGNTLHILNYYTSTIVETIKNVKDIIGTGTDILLIV
jgi:hypothetical protein